MGQETAEASPSRVKQKVMTWLPPGSCEDHPDGGKPSGGAIPGLQDRSPPQRAGGDLPRRAQEQRGVLSPLSSLVSKMKDMRLRKQEMLLAEIRGTSAANVHASPSPTSNIGTSRKCYSNPGSPTPNHTMPPLVSFSSSSGAARSSPVSRAAMNSHIFGKKVGTAREDSCRRRSVPRDEEKETNYVIVSTRSCCEKCDAPTFRKHTMPCGRTVSLCPECNSAFLALLHKRLPDSEMNEKYRQPARSSSLAQIFCSPPPPLSRNKSFGSERSLSFSADRAASLVYSERSRHSSMSPTPQGQWSRSSSRNSYAYESYGYSAAADNQHVPKTTGRPPC